MLNIYAPGPMAQGSLASYSLSINRL